MQAPTARETADKLVRERPRLHHDHHEQTHDWSLGGDMLGLLADWARPGWRALETGCGYSTVVLAASGADVVTVAPNPAERDAVIGWCEEAGIDTSRLRWQLGLSDEILPGLEIGVLDLLLVDGGHAFPTPFIDWYYAGTALRKGGLALIDDTHLPAPRVLRDFLDAETGRWERVTEVDSCAAFRRLTEGRLIGMDDWQSQGWRPEGTPRDNAQQLVAWARDKVRLRTRLKRLVGR